MLETGSSRRGHLPSQSDGDKIKNFEMIRENMRAEINVLISDRLSEDRAVLEERLKKFEGLDQRFETLKKTNEEIQKKISANMLQNQELESKFEAHKSQIGNLVNNSQIKAQEAKQRQEQLTAEIQGLRKGFEQLKVELGKVAGGNEAQVKLIESQRAQSEQKFANLEKLVQGLKNVSLARSQGPSSANGKPSIQDPQLANQLLVQNQDICYKVDSLRYELDLIKQDIIRQRRSQGDYISRVNSLEDRMEGVLASSKAGSEKSSTRAPTAGSRNDNFMSNSSAHTMLTNDLSKFSNDINFKKFNKIVDLKEYGQPIQQVTLGRGNSDGGVNEDRYSAPYKSSHGRGQQNAGNLTNRGENEEDNDASFLKKYASNHVPNDDEFGLNISVIKQADQSGLIERNELNNFMLGQQQSVGGIMPSKPIVTSSTTAKNKPPLAKKPIAQAVSQAHQQQVRV